MDIKVLKSDILTDNIPNFLIFVAEEPTLCRQYITSIAKTKNRASQYYETADAVIYDIDTNLKEDFIYIVYNDESLFKKDDYIKKLISTKRNIILYYANLDKESSFYKTYKNSIVYFNKVDKYSLLAYCQKQCHTHKVEVDQDKLLTLIEHCDCNLGIIMNELDKIFTLAQSNSNLLMDYMLNRGFSDYRKVVAFTIVDKILSRDKTVLEDIQRCNDSHVSLIVMLYNQAKTRLIKTTNLYYGKVMKVCAGAFQGIVDGTFGADYALKYIIYKVMGEQ